MVNRRKYNKRQLLTTFLIVLFLGFGVLILEKANIIDLYSKKQPNPQAEAKTTSTAPTAQEDFTGGNERPVNTTEKNEGTVQDTQGSLATSLDSSKWSSSKDGVITVYEPSKNGLVTGNSSLSGASSLSKVSFRLIDDVSGVIAQGTLSVANGKFSGNFDFSTSGTNGRLDIFSATIDGVESSNIEIPIRFK
jgi:hypothetical protein